MKQCLWIVVVLAMTGWLVGSAAGEQTYSGKSLAEWLRLIEDENPDRRKDAAYRLGEIGDPAATPALEKALQFDKDAEVRRLAAEAIRKIGAAQSVSTVSDKDKFKPLPGKTEAKPVATTTPSTTDKTRPVPPPTDTTPKGPAIPMKDTDKFRPLPGPGSNPKVIAGTLPPAGTNNFKPIPTGSEPKPVGGSLPPVGTDKFRPVTGGGLVLGPKPVEPTKAPDTFRPITGGTGGVKPVEPGLPSADKDKFKTIPGTPGSTPAPLPSTGTDSFRPIIGNIAGTPKPIDPKVPATSSDTYKPLTGNITSGTKPIEPTVTPPKHPDSFRLLPDKVATGPKPTDSLRPADKDKFRTLPNVGGKLDLQSIPALVKAMEYDGEKSVRIEAIVGLGEIGARNKSESVPPLIKALKDRDPEIRVKVARALGEMGPAAEAALPALQKLLEDEDFGARQAAQDAIQKITGKAAK